MKAINVPRIATKRHLDEIIEGDGILVDTTGKFWTIEFTPPGKTQEEYTEHRIIAKAFTSYKDNLREILEDSDTPICITNKGIPEILIYRYEGSTEEIEVVPYSKGPMFGRIPRTRDTSIDNDSQVVSKLIAEASDALLEKHGLSLVITKNDTGIATIPDVATDTFELTCWPKQVTFPVRIESQQDKLISITIGHYILRSKLPEGFGLDSLTEALRRCFCLT